MRLIALGAVVWSLSAGGAFAADRDKKKSPAPSSVLMKSYNALVKSKSYRTSLKIVGGVTDRKDHRVGRPTVKQNYSAEILTSKSTPIMRVDSPSAYRSPNGGAIRDGGVWRRIMAARNGRRLDRLFAFPEIVMRQALKHRKSAAWVPVKSKKKKTKKEKTKKKERDGKKRSKTTVGEADDSFPGYIRVVAPPKEALKHFIDVERSGCISGG